MFETYLEFERAAFILESSYYSTLSPIEIKRVF